MIKRNAAGVKKNSRGLTPAQERYCQERLKGKTQKQAYRDTIAQAGTKEKSLDECASRYERKPEIMARLEELTQKAAEGAIMDARQIQAELTDVALARHSERTEIRLKAIDQLSKLQGLYTEHVKHDVSAEVSLEDLRAAVDELFD